MRERLRSLAAIGEFSTVGFTMVGVGEPRQVRADVVSGSYFDVMGLRPVLGRVLDATDDGDAANAGATFQRACSLGFSPACGNVAVAAGGPGALQQAPPRLVDYRCC